MTSNPVLIGSASALRAIANAWRGSDEFAGAIQIGDGEISPTRVAQVASLDDIDFSRVPGDTAVLCVQPSPDEARLLLARATDAGVRLKIADGPIIRNLALIDLIGPVARAGEDGRLREYIAGKRVLITGG